MQTKYIFNNGLLDTLIHFAPFYYLIHTSIFTIYNPAIIGTKNETATLLVFIVLFEICHEFPYQMSNSLKIHHHSF